MNTPQSGQNRHLPVGQTPFARRQKPTILMCPPTYFTVAYAINPWMSQAAPCDVELAKKQWDNLYRAIKKQAGAEVELVTPAPGLPDLVFTANAAFVYQNNAIIAHFKHIERRGEEAIFAKWFDDNGFRVTRMPDHIFFEGAGDALIWQDRVFAGYKTRTDIASHSLLTAATDLPVLSMELIDERYYHIDVCLCPLEDGHLIYAPDSFDEYGLTVIEANVPAKKLIPVSCEEATQFACNAVNIGNTIILNQGSSKLVHTLKDRGFQVIEVDLSEFLKSGGSAKCLTLRIG